MAACIMRRLAGGIYAPPVFFVKTLSVSIFLDLRIGKAQEQMSLNRQKTVKFITATYKTNSLEENSKIKIYRHKNLKYTSILKF